MSYGTTTAAVCREFGQPLEIGELELLDPGPTEVVVAMDAAGVCHTDVSIRSGALPVALPMVLGHEGSGIVEAVGCDVDSVRIGDRVVLSWVPQCGHCYFCRRGQAHLCETGSSAVAAHGATGGQTRLRDGATEVRQLSGLGTFSSRIVAMQDSVVAVPGDLPAPIVSLIGCAVLTGFGAALNTAHIQAGDCVVVVGCGGVGQNILQGAGVRGAERIIAVDRDPGMREKAEQFGATDFVLSGPDAVAEVAHLTDGRGADVVLEAVGDPGVMTAALNMTRRGGEMVIVGMSRFDATWTIAPMPHFVGAERRILGCRYGSTDLARDVPAIIEHYRAGRLKLDDMLGASFPLAKVNDAMSGSSAASGRPVLRFG